MGQLDLNAVTKSFGQTDVIKGVDLTVADGEFCVFVGPSGCGKSTLLRIIAGLEDATSGDILIDGKRVNATAPADREIAMVFQSYALYPHLTVKDNMALGLKQAGTARATIDERVANACRMLSLEPLLARRPAELSGGQRQRVAIGRAIVRTPKLFLFDEPLSNLDAALRVHTRIEIARLHRELAATMVYVTHDQVEAMTLADKIVVLNAGRVEQVGAPDGALQRPRQHLRRRLHRLAADELPRGRRPRAHRARPSASAPSTSRSAARPRPARPRAGSPARSPTSSTSAARPTSTSAPSSTASSPSAASASTASPSTRRSTSPPTRPAPSTSTRPAAGWRPEPACATVGAERRPPDAHPPHRPRCRCRPRRWPRPAARAASASDIDQRADVALNSLLAQSPTAQALADKAVAILVFPQIVKAGFGFGGEFGEGALRRNDATVAYYNIASASFGFQIGAQAYSAGLLLHDRAGALLPRQGRRLRGRRRRRRRRRRPRASPPTPPRRR